MRDEEVVGRSRLPPTVRGVQILLVSALVAYVVSLIVRSSEGYDVEFEGFLANFALALCPVLCFLRVALVRVNRLAFALLGCGGLMFTAGNIVYVAHVQYLDPVPFPNLADAGYLGAYPFFIAAVLLLARADVGKRQIGVWLDGLVGVLGFAALGAALVLHTTLRHLTGNGFSLIVGASYPLSDLMLLSVIVGVLTLRGQWRGRQWGALASGLCVFAIGDIVYLLRLSTDSYVQGTFLDAFWLVGLAMVSISAWQPSIAGAEARLHSSGSLAVTIIFSLVAIAVLVDASSTTMPAYAVVIAAATLLAGLLRTVVAFHQVRTLAEVRHQATTDDLTGLPNRRAFTAFLDRALETKVADVDVAVLLLDLDRFKEVNDVLGHHIGDRLLCEVGLRLSPILRPEDLLARLGGDQFGLVLPGVGHNDAFAIAHRLCDALSGSFLLDGTTPQITGSVGIALWPLHSDTGHGLLQCADIAMCGAKDVHSEVALYDPAQGAEGRNKIAMARMLRLALDADQFVLHYQPKVDLRTDTVAGVEALVRWQHPTLGLLYPGAFLAIAEQIGLLDALTRWVLKTAVAQGHVWHMEGLSLTVAVNLSASNLTDEGLADDVAMMLLLSEFPASALNLEITETTLMYDPARATATLNAIHDLGVTLSVDDFGTGFSSLTYMRDLPVKELKIDRSFVTDIGKSRRDAVIVESTIELAHALGLRVVAEGVEEADALALLLRFGCDQAQGYHLCKPQPAEQLTAWLHRRSQQAPSKSTRGSVITI